MNRYFCLLLLCATLAAATQCPGGTQMCPGHETCCKLSSGRYGCCPLVKAVCCKDHRHCCPHGTICDVAHGRCKHGDKTADVREMEWMDIVAY